MKPFLSRTLLNIAYGHPRRPDGAFDISKIKKILLIRRNGFGDMICALPLIRNIRNAMPPETRIDILASERNACIIRNLNLVDRIHLYTRGSGILRNHYLNLPRVVEPIINENYDLLIAIKGGFSPLLATISYATRIPWRLGYVPSKGHNMDYCFNLRVELPVEREHQVESCLRFLQPLGLPQSCCDLSIRLENEHEKYAAELLIQYDLRPQGFVLLNVSSERVESRWEGSSWVKTAMGVHQQFGLPVIACGLPRDRTLLENLQMHAPEAVRLVCEPPGIQHFAALAKKSCFVMCGDGGPMHVTAAVGRPVFVLFSATDPTIWRPYNVSFEYVQKDRLVSSITPEDVMEKLQAWVPTL